MSEVVELGRGTDSVAYLIGGAWVARLPLVEDARASLRRELALLPALAPALPVAIPAVAYVGRDPLFAAYPLLPGEPLTVVDERVLADLAAVLRALHAFDVRQAARLGVRAELLHGGYHEAQRDLPRLVASALSRAERALLDAEFARFERDHRPAVAVLHSDLKPAHLLVSHGRLTGLLDWGDVALGDPHFDLAVFGVFCGEDALLGLLEHLPEHDAATVLDKARFFITLRWTQDLAFVLRRGDGAAAADAARRLSEHIRRQRGRLAST